MEGVGERVTAWALRTASTALVFAGIAFFVAGIPVFSATSGPARDILVVVLQIGGAWVLLGAGVLFTTRRRSLARAPGGVLALALILTLVTVPAWLVWRLRSFLSEWRVLAELASSSNFFETANANMSGVILVPLAAALAPPFIELAALTVAVATSCAAIGLIAGRSARFGHLYIASVMLLTALVIGSVRGARVASMAVDAVQPFIEESKPRPEEYQQIREIVDRYTGAVAPTATTLAWAWVGYAAWIPVVVLTGRR